MQLLYSTYRQILPKVMRCVGLLALQHVSIVDDCVDNDRMKDNYSDINQVMKRTVEVTRTVTFAISVRKT